MFGVVIYCARERVAGSCQGLAMMAATMHRIARSMPEDAFMRVQFGHCSKVLPDGVVRRRWRMAAAPVPSLTSSLSC